MNAENLVQELRDRGVALRHENGRLMLSAPRGVIDADMQSRLRAHKQEVLALLDAEQAEESEPLPDGVHPLSSIQQSMWYLESEQDDYGIFNLYLALEMNGPLDVAALQSALRDLLARHAALRARVVEVNGRLAQRVEPALEVELPVSGLPDDESVLQQRLTDELVRPFNTLQGPLHRYQLFRLGAGKHVLLFVADHMMADGTSMAILKRELLELYAAKTEGREPALPELPASYFELVRDEHRWLKSAAARRQLGYWKRRLAGELPVLSLPQDREHPEMPSGRGEYLRLPLSHAMHEAMNATAHSLGASTFMLVSAAMATVLATLGGQQEVVIGTPVANRNRTDSENVVGLFMNPVALRIPVDRSGTFDAVAATVRSRAIEALDNQSMPFDEVVKALGPVRDLSRTPVFQAMVTFLPDAAVSVRAGKLRIRPLNVRRGTSQTDVAIWCRECDEGLAVDMEYNTDVFDADTARDLLDRFARVLAAIVENPRVAIADLPLLTEDERARLKDWGEGPSHEGPAARIDALVRGQAEQTPHATAISCNGRTQDYATLLERAGRVATGLRAAGVTPGDIVGVELARELDLPAALLGVLECGAAYLPLDAEAPEERTQWMLEDAKVTHVLSSHTETETPSGALTAFGGRVVGLASLLSASETDQAQQEMPPATGDLAAGSMTRSPNQSTGTLSPDDIAYVIYTSGSTGKPKGVKVPHRAVTNFLRGMRECLSVDASDRFLALTTLGFDIAVLELWLPLVIGARTDIVPRDVAREGDALRAHLEHTPPSVMQATPATWQMLLAAGWQGDPGLTVLSGGEALPAPLARELIQRSRATWNLYGPTETTVWSTAHRVHESDDPVPIGRPIANTIVKVLDAARQPVPPGVPGELYIGGAGVTDGYLNRPELTRERFVEDTASRSRLYRTGDRVRFDEQGRLIYLGRTDFQIKLRGHRIEPGEIEAALTSHPAVERAVAVVREIDGDPRLVAYMTLGSDARVSIAELRAHMKRALPSYMLPQHFVALDAMPLTPSGKIDRRQLPSPAALPERERIAPATDTEKRIAAIWQDVLGTTSVSADDNFFDLGGHSLSSMKAIARIHEELGARLRPRLLVLNTLREIAAACDARIAETASAAMTTPSMEGSGDENAARAAAGGKRWKSMVDALLGRA